MWTSDEVRALRDIAEELGVDPRDMVRVMCNESGCLPSAHNPGGAVGLIQFEPDTLRFEGWTGGTDAFARLSVAQQLPYVLRYYRARQAAIAQAGGGLGALYVATFLPALTARAGDTTFALCGDHGQFAWAYAENRGFDVGHKGWITVGDMVAAAERAYASSALGRAIVAALETLDAPVAASPVEASLDVDLGGEGPSTSP